VASSALIIQALALVQRALSGQTAQNVDLDEVTLAGEGVEFVIVLVPHRDLGGYALIVSAFENRLLLSWGAVHDMQYHDDIDLARPAFLFDNEGWADSTAVRAALDAEIRRPIDVTLRRTRFIRRWQLYCEVAVAGKPTKSFVRNVAPPGMQTKDGIVELGTTSLVGPDRPSTRWPVPLAEWRRYADPAWPART
jgi:hypothetical protein